MGGRFPLPDGIRESQGFFSAADGLGDPVEASSLLCASVERPWPPFVLCGATCEVKPFLSAVCPPPLGLTDLKGAIVRKPK